MVRVFRLQPQFTGRSLWEKKNRQEVKYVSHQCPQILYLMATIDGVIYPHCNLFPLHVPTRLSLSPSLQSVGQFTRNKLVYGCA